MPANGKLDLTRRAKG